MKILLLSQIIGHWVVAKTKHHLKKGLVKIRVEKIYGIFSCHDMITKVKYIFILVEFLGGYVVAGQPKQQVTQGQTEQ